MIDTFARIMGRVSEQLAFVGMILISASITVTMVDIIGRKTVKLSVFGVNDIGQLLVMSCICLAMPLTFLREGHVGVDFVTDPLPPRALAFVKFAAALLGLVFVAVLVRYAFVQAQLQVGKGDRSVTL